MNVIMERGEHPVCVHRIKEEGQLADTLAVEGEEEGREGK